MIIARLLGALLRPLVRGPRRGAYPYPRGPVRRRGQPWWPVPPPGPTLEERQQLWEDEYGDAYRAGEDVPEPPLNF